MKKTVLVKAPALTQSGYGEHSRLILRALRAHEDRFDVYLILTKWGNTGWIWDDTEERQWIDQIAQKTLMRVTQGPFRPDIFLHVSIPGEFEQLANVNIGITAGVETTKISAQWVAKCNQMTKIFTISKFARDSILRTERDIQTPHGS